MRVSCDFSRWSRGVAAMALMAATLQAGPAVAQQRATQTIPLRGATSMLVNVTGDLHVVADASASVVTVVGSSPVGAPPLHVEVAHSGRQLDLKLAGPPRSLLPFTASGHAYTLTYPAGLAISVREFSGGVHVAHARAPLEVYNASGSIDIDGASARVAVESDNGPIAARGIAGDIDATTSNGAVHVALVRGWKGREVRLESSNGALTLVVPPAFHAHYDCSSGDGRVTNPFRSDAHAPLVFMLTERGDVTVTRESL